MFKDFFKLEKKPDGIYRCKGGTIADIIFLLTFLLLSGIDFLLNLVGLESRIINKWLFGTDDHL